MYDWAQMVSSEFDHMAQPQPCCLQWMAEIISKSVRELLHIISYSGKVKNK